MILVVMMRADVRLIYAEKGDQQYFVHLKRDKGAHDVWRVYAIQEIWSDYDLSMANNIIFLTEKEIRERIPDIICDALKNEKMVEGKVVSPKYLRIKKCRNIIFDILETI